MPLSFIKTMLNPKCSKQCPGSPNNAKLFTPLSLNR